MSVRWMVLGISGFLLLASLCTGVKQIRPGERAVVRRFGRVLEEKPAPGLWLGLPWGIDQVDRVSITLIRRLEVGYQLHGDDGQSVPSESSASDQILTPRGQLLTGDHNLVNVRVAIDYQVAPQDEDIVDYLLNQDRVDGVLGRVVEGVLVEWTANRRIDDILIRGKGELPVSLPSKVKERLRFYQLGIQVNTVNVIQLLPPDEVKSAFEDVTRAQATIRTRQEEALRTAVKRSGEAQRDKNRKEQQALAYADEQGRQANGDASAFEVRRVQYQKLRQENPDVLTAIWWDTMTRVFAGMKESGRLDFLDNHLAGDGLDISLIPPLPRKK